MARDVVEKLVTCVHASAALDEKTDEEIADLLDEHVLAHTSMLTVQFDVLDAAVNRLRLAHRQRERALAELDESTRPRMGRGSCAVCRRVLHALQDGGTE